MKVTTQPYKGARDFYPEEKAFQKWMFAKWREVVERFGYEEYDAPILEPTDIFLLKGSQEIVDEQTYTFKDRGDRSVTIRTEMTPTVSRLVAGRRQELAYPVRWYSIPNLWRYERMQRGRGREFYQLNVDIFGVSSMQAELEMIQIADGLLQAFNAKRSSYTIKINSRVLVNKVMGQAGLDKETSLDVIRLIDRIQKMSQAEFSKKLKELVPKNSGLIEQFIKAKTVSELPKEVTGRSQVRELNDLLENCKSQGISNVEFDPSLTRGFDYYTDIVFEVFDNDPENNRSMFGGGRYDGLVGLFGAEPVPTVGFGMGDITFQNFLESHKLVPALETTNDVTILVKDVEVTGAAQKLSNELRDNGVNVAVDYSERKIDKQLKSAAKSGVRYVIFVGKIEADAEKYTLKDLTSGKEQIHTAKRIADIIKS